MRAFDLTRLLTKFGDQETEVGVVLNVAVPPVVNLEHLDILTSAFRMHNSRDRKLFSVSATDSRHT